jgi:hypothetical protein
MGWWEGARAKLLSAGPLGLGAIIVLVTGTILLTGKAVEQGRLKLSLSLLIAGCALVLAGLGVLVLQTNAATADANARLASAQAATQHQLYFRIEPLDSEKTLPAPDIIINNDKLAKPSYAVKSDITVIIDVSKALRQSAQATAQSTSSNDKTTSDKKVREQLSADIDTSIAQIQRIVQLMSQSCPGGAHGTNPLNYENLVSLTNSIVGSLQTSKIVLAVGNDKTASGKKVREQLSADIDASIAQVQKIVQLMNQNCSGGAHGVNPFHYDDVVNLTNSIVGSLQKSKSVISTTDF